MLFSAYVEARDYSHCEAVLRTAARDVTWGAESSGSLNTVFDAFCERDGSVKSQASGFNLDVDALDAIAGLGFSTSGSTNRVSEFCRDYSSRRESSAARSYGSDVVVEAALDAFTQCVQLTNKDVIFQPSGNLGINTTFYISFRQTENFGIQGVQTEGDIKCTVLDPRRRTQVNAGPSTNFSYKTAVSAYCNRSPVGEPEGTDTYGRATVTFNTTHGLYTVVYPEEGLLANTVATHIWAEMSHLSSRLNDTQTELESLRLATQGLDLECKVTDFGDQSQCEAWPDATPPDCGDGYHFVGIAGETHTDGGCGNSALNRQRVKAACCRIKTP